MQNLIRGGGATGGGGEFSQAPWTNSQYFEREVGENFIEIIPRPDQPIKFSIFNGGSESLLLSLGEGRAESPWIIAPGDLFEEEILESLYARGNTFIKTLVRSRSLPDPPTPTNPILFIPAASQTHVCPTGSFLWNLTPPLEPSPISVDFSLVESWWSGLILIKGYPPDGFSPAGNELWQSNPYAIPDPANEPTEDNRLILRPTETALYVGLWVWDVLGGSVNPICTEWVQETKSFRILSETSFI
ncbi:hypothetical protein NG791_28650 [Laspinema sp. D1]|uniref:hypothetical protein n=1 Tax=Laspinema palackyanum TaxID=3231601 RepID=UPI003476045D|nr:hypothetical protein [Laspinema sp. D2b]